MESTPKDLDHAKGKWGLDPCNTVPMKKTPVTEDLTKTLQAKVNHIEKIGDLIEREKQKNGMDEVTYPTDT